jgi:predicted phage tail protein
MNIIPFNALGSGPSADISSVIPSYLADAINDLSVGYSDQSLTLSWTAPNSEGSAITQYNIYNANNNQLLTSTTSLSYQFLGLANGTTYSYYVTSVNANGESEPSNTVSNYPSTIPDAPLNLQLTDSNSSSYGQELTLSWSPPYNGGDAIQNYIIFDD